VLAWPRSPLPSLALLPLLACGRRPDGALHVVIPDLDAAGPGEATLVVGPSGATVLLDAANDRHAVELHALVGQYGYAGRVDDLVVTSYSAEHVGGIDDLLDPASEDALDVGRVITRGPFDLDADADIAEYADICAPLEASGVPRLDLCAGASLPACEGEGAPIPATACDGLRLGDVDDAADDADGAVTFVDLGEGARLELLYVDGYTADGALDLAADEGAATEGFTEGGRSVVVRVAWGDFVYLRGGDIGGSAADGPDVEGALVAAGLGGPVDLLQLDRHGAAGASGDAWLGALLDGESHADAIVSGGAAFADSPDADVVARVNERLGGGQAWATSIGEGGASDAVSTCQPGEDLVVDVDAAGAVAIACVPRDAP